MLQTHCETLIAFKEEEDGLPPKTIPTIETLPDEILLDIFRELEGSNQTLCNLSLTSQRFCGIAQEVLVTNIFLDCGFSVDDFHSENGKPRVLILIYTLHKRPDLAKKVNKLCFRTTLMRRWTSHGKQRICESYAGDPPELERVVFLEQCRKQLHGIRAPIRPNKISGISSWWRKICIRQQSTLLGVLLMLIPNLQKLDIETVKHHESLRNRPKRPMNDLFGIAKFTAVPSALPRLLPCLSNLTTLSIQGTYLPLLRVGFGRLKALEVSIWDLYDDRRDRESLDQFQSNPLPTFLALESLSIKSRWEALIRDTKESQYISRVISLLQCYKIRLFTLSVKDELPEGLPLKSIHFQLLLNSLQSVANSLECLTVDWCPDIYESCLYDSRRSPFYPMRSFEGFSSLRRLRVPQQALIRPYTDQRTSLPHGLAGLTIYGPNPHVIDLLKETGIHRTGLPHLLRITLHCLNCWGAPSYWFEQDLRPSLGKLRTAGIAVDIVQDEWLERSDWINVWEEALPSGCGEPYVFLSDHYAEYYGNELSWGLGTEGQDWEEVR